MDREDMVPNTPTVDDALRHAENDYQAQEAAFRKATGAELLSIDVLGGAHVDALSGRTAVVMPAFDECDESVLRSCLEAWSKCAVGLAAPPALLLAGPIGTDRARRAAEGLQVDVRLLSCPRREVWPSLNAAVAELEADFLILTPLAAWPGTDCLGELAVRLATAPGLLLVGFSCPLDSGGPTGDRPLERDPRLNRQAFPENLFVASDHLRRLGCGRTLSDTTQAVTDLPALVAAGPMALRRSDFETSGGFDPELDSWPLQLNLLAARSLASGCRAIPTYTAVFGLWDPAPARVSPHEDALLRRRLRAPIPPFAASAPGGMSVVLTRSAQTPPRPALCAPRPVSHLRMASRALAAGQCERALVELNTAERDGERLDAGSFVVAARAARALGRTAEAMDSLLHAASLGHDLSVVEVERALLLAQEGRFDEGQAALRRAVATEPQDPRVTSLSALGAADHSARGRHHLAQGMGALARQDFELALLADGTGGEVWGELGQALLTTGETPDAITAIEKALARGVADLGRRGALYALLGRAHMILGHRVAAKLALDAAVDSQPGNATARIALRELADAGEALHQLPHVELDPTINAIEGWLAPEEQALLGRAVRAAAALGHPLLEVGSYCGKSTVVTASVMRSIGARTVVYAVDPHEGFLEGRYESSRSVFQENIRTRGLEPWVRMVEARSTDVHAPGPFGLVFIDGDHAYESVHGDILQFRASLPAGGFLAFHDYSRHWPGVRRAVQEVLTGGGFDFVSHRGGLIVLRRTLDPMEWTLARTGTMALDP
jgi:tetratricopeptide (TPR) repeat protein